MQVYRLVRREFALNLDGKGASLFGGKWNSAGLPVIYTALHRSLAVLEYRVNNPLPVRDLLMVTLEVPDHSAQSVFADQLLVDWVKYSFDSPCVRIGEQWLSSHETLLLKVPSAVVPQEHNILINPQHPFIKEVKMLDALPFLIDTRMY